MNLKNSVSVLIPNFNNQQWLEQCIESCLAQGSLLKEIIIVDDHSIDDSLKILKDFSIQYPQIIKVFTNPEKGANTARNYAFTQSTGHYIQWLDSDDRLLPGKFDKQIIPLQNGEVDIVYSDWQTDFWNNGQLIKSEQKTYQDYPDFLEELIKDNWTSPNNYLMTSAMAEKLAGGIGWNPETKVGQDREYFTMTGILGARFKYASGTFAIYNRQSSGTISGMDFKERLELNQALEGRFRKEIEKQDWITPARRKKYLGILDTHKLKACFYNSKIKLDRPISPFSICWDLMHWKMRLVMPWVFLRAHVDFLFSK
jgi:glycosyltransferase involved in cell wall biosynthesis